MQKSNRIILDTPPVFSFDECLLHLGRNENECLYRITDKKLTKAIKYNTEQALFRISYVDKKIIIDFLSNNPSKEIQQYIEEYVTEWFDLGCDITPFYDLLKQNSRTEYMVDDFYGLLFIGMPDLYETMSWTIIGQLINLNFAYSIKRDFVERYGKYIEFEGDRYYLFPEPEIISKLSVEELKTLRITTTKAKSLITVASMIANKELSKAMLQSLTSFEQKQETLTSIKGVGVWTANYTLLKCLKEKNTIPYGDAVLLNAMIKNKIIEDKKDITTLENFYNQFEDWKHYLTVYIWRSAAKMG